MIWSSMKSVRRLCSWLCPRPPAEDEHSLLSENEPLLPERVRQLLGSAEWQRLSGTKLPDLRSKLRLLVAASVPPMVVLPAATLRLLGRIPHSSEGHQVAVDSVLEDRPVFLFFSHRWLSPGQNRPDDADHSKARALIAWCDWYERVYTRSAHSRHVYLWIDCASSGFQLAPQAALPAAEPPALPAIAAANFESSRADRLQHGPV